MTEHPLSDYKFSATSIDDHIIISIRPEKPDLTVEGEKVAVYCIAVDEEMNFNHCVKNSKTLEGVLAFLEVKSIRPNMSKLEYDILLFWHKHANK